MPFLKTPDLQPVRGADFSIPSTYLPPGYHFPQNLQYVRGELTKRLGKALLGEVSLGQQKIIHHGIFKLSSETVKLVRHTIKNTQVYNAASGAWDNFSGSDLSGSESDYFDSTVVTELDMYIFVNNAINNPRKMLDGVNSTDLLGSPPKAKCCEYVTPYLLLGNLIEGGNNHPYKLAWCDTGNPEVWSGALTNAGSVFLSDEPSPIRKIKKLKNYAMVYKDESVYRGFQVGSPDIWDFLCLGLGNGIYSPRAIADNGIQHFYMGLQDFYMHDGLRPTSFGKPVREYIFNRLNRAVNQTCHAVHVEQYKEIWFFITLTGLTLPTEIWKYNYELDFWYMDTVANCISSAMYKQTSFKSWNQTVGSWDSQVGNWDKQSGVANAPLPVFGLDTGFTLIQNGNSYDDVGIAVDSHLDTKDFFGESASLTKTYTAQKGIERDARWLQVDLFARGDSVKLSYSIDNGETWVYVGENQLNSSKIQKTTFWFDVISSQIRFRIQQNTKSKNLVLRSLQPYFLDAGEILKNT